MSLVSLILETIKAVSLFATAYIAYCFYADYKNTPAPSKKEKPAAKSKRANVDWQQPAERKFRAKVYEE